MTHAVQQWPEAFAARYRERGYWRGDTLGAVLRARAARTPGRVAVVGGEARWTYRELDRRADALAAGFRAMGLKPGERVVVQLPNIPEFFSVIFGLFRARVLPVYALPAHRRAEIVHIANAAEAAALVVADGSGGFQYTALAREVRSLVPSLRHVIVAGAAEEFTSLEELSVSAPADNADAPAPSDVAFMQLSGGSTGLPKLIPRTHDDYLYSVRASVEICGLDEESVYLGALPIAHNFPMSSPGFLGYAPRRWDRGAVDVAGAGCRLSADSPRGRYHHGARAAACPGVARGGGASAARSLEPPGASGGRGEAHPRGRPPRPGDARRDVAAGVRHG